MELTFGWTGLRLVPRPGLAWSSAERASGRRSFSVCGPWCMSALRLVLIVGNALIFAWTAYIFPSSHATVHTSDYVFGLGVLTCSGINLVYLFLNL
jgi:hypothetical protein